ncbi:hypothetical protein ANANG_G00216130 [Anguilla anguilla]|uniref:Neuron navigator 1 n=1 Tax=Anguilla anguilla TaxID=7936 RepID=A0A9D3RPC5_ANGAN|nr:hypothetical protein ANANG_G00216130 [Anguilla anguilla]
MSGRVLNGKMLQLPAQRVGRTMHFLSSWDESSSISSGLSDASDNLSSEEFNASSSLCSLPTTPVGSRCNSAIALRTDAEKHSLVESGLSWYSEEGGKAQRKALGGAYDTGSLKTESASKWRKSRPRTPAARTGGPGGAEEAPDAGSPQRPEKEPPITQPPRAQSGRSPPSVQPLPTPPRACSKWQRQRVSRRPWTKPRWRSRGPRCSGRARTPGRSAATTASPRRAWSAPRLAAPSATRSRPGDRHGDGADRRRHGHLQRLGDGGQDAQVLRHPGEAGRRGWGRGREEDQPGRVRLRAGLPLPNARNNIQYRSLPRPAKSSAMSLTSRPGSRPVSGGLEGSLLSLKPAPPPPTPRDTCPKQLSLRPTSGSRFSELTSPTSHRAQSKSLGKPASLMHLDKVNSNSLDSTMMGIESELPPKAGLAPPGGSPLLYPRLSGLHRSMESLPLPMSVPPAGAPAAEPRERDEDRAPSGWSASSRTSLTLLDSSQRDRNTLPKKGLSRYGSAQSEEDSKERRHSHTIVSLTESQTPDAPVAHLLLPLLRRQGPLHQLPPPPPTAPQNDPVQQHPRPGLGVRAVRRLPLGSSLSLADRPKSMIRSGSFREPGDDVHGSVLSLASSASSTYSSQIRKLRRELESSQEKVANLTTQLSANANLVAAFEQSLALMTTRLQSLSVSADQKDNELGDLRETIELLKTKNTEAQAVIHGALNNPDIAPKELRIKRQNSSESISSLNSITSHSSVGSCKDTDAKKKKKKSWLRSSFNKAFSIKKGPKSATSYSDIEEIATPTSSAPSSPKLSHEGGDDPPLSLEPCASASSSSSAIFEGSEEQENEENEEKMVSDLRSELWEKEMKLTDIRLEALNSAHQLEQLRDAMNSMQMTVENLKAENDQLKTGTGGKPPSGPPTSTSQPSGLTSLLGSSPRQSLNMSLTKSFSMSLNDSNHPDFSPVEALSAPLGRDDVLLRVVVRLPDQRLFKDEVKQQDYFIGTVKINGKTDWVALDTAVSQAFKDYIVKVDPTSSLGLSVDSICSYSVNQGRRVMGGAGPETTPSWCLGKGPCCITVALKGLKEKCVDSLVFETLVPKPMMQHYISLLLKHRRLILSGPSGTGKTYLTSRLAEYLVERSGRELSDSIAVTYNMHRQSCKDLQLYLSNLANQIDRETSTGDVPLVVVLDDLSDSSSISELVNGALTCKYHKCPYIIGTTNQPVKMTPNHGLHLSFRMVTFSNNVEPANGFLVRYLHRKLTESETEGGPRSAEVLRVLDWVPELWYHLHTFLEKHSTSDFLIGPCFFLSCPVTVEEFRSWFIDLWNLSIIPYLQEGAKDGIKVHGQKAVWEDPVEWRGPGRHRPAPEERVAKETPPSSLDSDPLMAMLLKLQEAANYIESPDRETVADPNLQSTL